MEEKLLQNGARNIGIEGGGGGGGGGREG